MAASLVPSLSLVPFLPCGILAVGTPLCRADALSHCRVGHVEVCHLNCKVSHCPTLCLMVLLDEMAVMSERHCVQGLNAQHSQWKLRVKLVA